MADDPITEALAEIRERHRGIDCAAAAYLSAGAIPRLLTGFEILLKAHARYTTTELHTELLTALRGNKDA